MKGRVPGPMSVKWQASDGQLSTDYTLAMETDLWRTIRTI